MSSKVVAFLAILAVSSAGKEPTRWSRQLSTYTSDISDWVPLRAPVERELPQIKRQAIAEPRILSEPFAGFVRPTGFSQETFPSRAFYNSPANRQLYLQSVPSAPQNYLSDQGFGQGLRFGLTQPNFPLSQGFISPQFTFDNVPQIKPRPQTGPVTFETSQQTSQHLPSSNLNPHTLKPFQPLKPKHEIPKFVDGYRAVNSSDFNFPKQKPQPSHKIKFDSSDVSKESFGPPKKNVEREEVQLVYVPLDSLNRGQFNFRSPLTSAQLLNTELYNPNHKSNPLMQNLAAEFQGPIIKPFDTFNSQAFVTNFNSQLHQLDSRPKFSTATTSFTTAAATTPKPKKLKPHQPPLAIFLTQDAKKESQVKVGDVLYSLKNANTVPVLDSVNPLNAPKVFIGPSSLSPPENYVKFELPYLSNIENSDKKLRQLPFFVAPLSYNTPQGFAKIPFPSPHVGSVIINSLIKDTPQTNKATTATNYYGNSYSEPMYKQEHNLATQKPKISYYTTSSPQTNSPTYDQNYYSIEPQSVSTLRPLKEQEAYNSPQSTPVKTTSYSLSNVENNYKPTQFVNFPQDTRFKPSDASNNLNVFKVETTTTPRTTVTSTTKLPTTHASQLLETHNPYSINQAFHFSTPLDYHNFFDEYREPYSTAGIKQLQSPSTTPVTPASQTTKQVESEQSQPQSPQPIQQSLPNYLQNYTPELHHESEVQNSRYPTFNTNNYSAKINSVPGTQYNIPSNPANADDNIKTINYGSQENIKSIESIQPTYENDTNEKSNQSEYFSNDAQSTKSSAEYNNYDVAYNSHETQSSTTSSTTTTTTTRRSPIRTRGRPRYPTTKSESGESSTRATITRRPLRERKPLPVRQKFETNKITSENPVKNQFDTIEISTKASRARTRGKVHFRPSDGDELYPKRNKQKSKEEDLAYQRDVLHQNYPVTLMERASTADIEAITEPSEKSISANNLEVFKTQDTEDAYSYDKVSITEPSNRDIKDLVQQYTTAVDSVTDISYTQKIKADEINDYQPQGTKVPPNDEISYGDTRENNYSHHISPEYNVENQDMSQNKPPNSVAEQNASIYSVDDVYQSKEKEEIASSNGDDNAKILSQEINQEQEHEENIVETTPSYNRVRIRPGVIRQYHQASTTEYSRLKNDRRKPLQAITYRPAFDKRRTTMKIEEIEADLKTKQIHIRPEFQDYKQPVYKPEPSTESITSSTTETSTKRSQFRRRRPNYTVTSTEGAVTRRNYEIKNRFRGRRPTEKPTEKSENEADVTTVKNNLHSRYSHRPRLSERYNKKPETDDQVTEDQDSNYSINRPKYAVPESDRWSPKISKDSFKPFNPNNIADDVKVEENIDKPKDEELDIITARNEYEDILISVTPATNNRAQKKIPDIPPTLEALVEQSKVTKADSNDSMSTFESMLEEVMKNLEEQDENEYTGKVMKHKGGEIGEIPPEKIISSGENYSLKSTTPLQDDLATTTPDHISPLNETEVMYIFTRLI